MMSFLSPHLHPIDYLCESGDLNGIKSKFKDLAQTEIENILCTRLVFTPLLTTAVQKGFLDIVEYFIQCGANMEQLGSVTLGFTSHFAITALWCASATGRLDVVKMLVGHGALLNPGKTRLPLAAACEFDNLEIAEFLIEKGAKIGFRDYRGYTPLRDAYLSGHGRMVELLKSHPSCRRCDKIDTADILGCTVMDNEDDMASAMDFWGEAMVERQPQITPLPMATDLDGMRLHSILVRGSISGHSHVDTLYSLDGYVGQYLKTGDYDMCIRMWTRSLDMRQRELKTLCIDKMFSPFLKLLCGMPLRSLKFADVFAVLRIALRERPQPKSVNIMLNFIWLLCQLRPTQEEDIELRRAVYHLIRRNVRTSCGDTLLIMACTNRFEMIQFLLDCGAPLHDKNKKQNTPLHIIAWGKPIRRDILNILLDHGARPDSVNHLGQSPRTNIEKAGITISPLLTYNLQQLDLQCLCVEVVVKHEISCHGLPGRLRDFILTRAKWVGLGQSWRLGKE